MELDGEVVEDDFIFGAISNSTSVGGVLNLDPSQVEWSVEHPFIATVDENGFVQAVSYGTTAVIVKYGDQQVQCIVRCK